ncbi:transcriptional regulator [Gluconacetobacter liquefaciens]|uniref:AraC family transcriptional regulator n=1 Tax=Gluconacetobacter liquefaciens TaxID=89584 RepID=A0A370G687_GLULI|nr:helix-turn-helix transcriptional regulator [Gluconacetobacter liquefaciens]MBB2185525.1 helix-turn-helix transcriptional regulator [Gluconacetobacter liquefaciens]RDI39328.1 AraC family transcriptional regulator [Gluconacetobacter liquefaciens]GEB35966.1 transcriptional regulator [Gluconacetobacter liquefaciens]
MKARSDGIPDFEELPGNIYFRHQNLEPALWVTHSHPWGQLNFVSRGTLNLEIDGQKFLSPPQYAVWIPPFRVHASWNSMAATYRTVYLSQECSRAMPDRPRALAIGPLLKAILDEFARIDVRLPTTPQEERMAAVAIDQIQSASTMDVYLPFASTPFLQNILDDTKAKLHKQRTTEQVAQEFNLTTRTLERRCKAELGVSFGEWRQRLRFAMALDALGEGRTVQQISYDLGYSSSSAFISMFRRLSGQTPEQYRKTL